MQASLEDRCRIFSEAELYILKTCYAEMDPESTGYVEFSDLTQLLSSAGVRVPDGVIGQLLELLEVDLSSKLSFSEVVDIAAIVSEL